MITFTQKGDFANTERFLRSVSGGKAVRNALEFYAQEGVSALSAATPIDSGLSASSWYYLIENNKNWYSITWCNRDADSNGTPIVILLQYGHSTRNGGYVQGYDFINPAIRPIFDRISNQVWRAVTTA